MIYAYQTKNLDLQAECTVRMTKEYNGKTYTKRITTSVGRVLFNNIIPQDLGYVDRTKDEEKFRYEVDFLVTKKAIG